MPGIDDWLSSYDVGERHEVTVRATPAVALERMLATPVAPDRFVWLLLCLRGLKPRGSIEAFMAANGFLLLERTETTFVVGFYAGPSRVPDAAAWKAASEPRSIKAAADFRAEPAPDGARLITETRVATVGLLARVIFRVYWLAVGPFSALIRRHWLRAAATR